MPLTLWIDGETHNVCTTVGLLAPRKKSGLSTECSKAQFETSPMSSIILHKLTFQSLGLVVRNRKHIWKQDFLATQRQFSNYDCTGTFLNPCVVPVQSRVTHHRDAHQEQTFAFTAARHKICSTMKTLILGIHYAFEHSSVCSHKYSDHRSRTF